MDQPPLWDPSLETGIPLIDGQHRKLVAQIEVIFAAAANPSLAAVSLRFLERYTQEHFTTEERYLTQHGFPGRAQHVEAHAAFRTSVSRAIRLVENNPDGQANVRLVRSMVLNWLTSHIKGMDQEYADYCLDEGLLNRRPLAAP